MNLTTSEKIYLKNNMDIYFITGIIGLFIFFSFSYYAKYLGELYVYIISEIGMFVSGILYIASFTKIHKLNKEIVKEVKYKDVSLVLDKEKKKKSDYLVFLVVSIIILITSLKITSYVVIDNSNILMSMLFIIITFISSYIIGKIFLILENSILIIKDIEKNMVIN